MGAKNSKAMISLLFVVFGFMIVESIWEVSARYIIASHDVHPAILTCVSIITSSIVLIVAGGKNRAVFSILTHAYTWLYGLAQVGMIAFLTWALAYISSTEINLIWRVTIVLSILFSWVFFKRPVYKTDYIGGSILLAGIAYVAFMLNEDVRLPALICLFISAVLRPLHNA